jgi:hypothetical protein
MTPAALLRAHRDMWRRAFSPELVAQRLARGARTLRAGGMMLSAAMNGFYGLKRVTGNLPKTAARANEGLIAHPAVDEAPVRLLSLLRRDAADAKPAA